MPYKNKEDKKAWVKKRQRWKDPDIKEYMKEYHKKWYQKNKEKRRISSRLAKAKQRGIETGNIEELLAWYKEQDRQCYYCGREMEDLQWDRLDSKNGYVLGNVVLACFECNRYKSDIFTDGEWFEILEKYNLVDRY